MGDLIRKHHAGIRLLRQVSEYFRLAGSYTAGNSYKSHRFTAPLFRPLPVTSCTSISSITDNCAAPCISSARIFRTSCSSSAAVSTSSSSCTVRISRDFNPSASRRSCTRFMAILIMSAAVPCIGEFIAMRSPNERCIKLLEESSGIGRLLPNIVVT